MFGSVRGGEGDVMTLKCRNQQKAHLGHILNLHTEFKLSNSIWSGAMRETN